MNYKSRSFSKFAMHWWLMLNAMRSRLCLISLKYQKWQNANFLHSLFIVFMLKVVRFFFVFPQMFLLQEKSPLTLDVPDLNFKITHLLEQQRSSTDSVTENGWESQNISIHGFQPSYLGLNLFGNSRNHLPGFLFKFEKIILNLLIP